MQQVIENAVVQSAKAIEDQLDAEIHRQARTTRHFSIICTYAYRD